MLWVCLYIITLLDCIQPIGLFFFENLTQHIPTRLCTHGGVETTASIFTGLSEYSVLNYYHIIMLGHPSSYLKRQNSTMKWCSEILFILLPILLPNTDYINLCYYITQIYMLQSKLAVRR